MKTIYLLLSIFYIIFIQPLFAQPCNIQISGGNCLGTTLSADFSTGILSNLTWKLFGSNIYIADTITNSESVSIVAGGRGNGASANQLGFPSGGIAMDNAGNIYIADSKNNRVQKWAPGASSGVTVAGGYSAGNNANQLSYPKDVFVDKLGNIYIADTYNNRIQKWVIGATSGVTVAGGNGVGSAMNQLNNPTGVCVDDVGNVYIADASNYRIQRWGPGATRGISVGSGGYGIGAGQFLLPVDVYVDNARNVYVADEGISNANGIYNRVRKWIKGTTNYQTIAGGNGQTEAADQLNNITSIFVDKDRNLYIADAGNRRIQKWAPGASAGVTVAGGYGIGNQPRQVYYATGVCLGADSNVYVMDGANYAVKKFIPSNGVVKNTLTPKQAGVYRVEATFKNGCTIVSNPVTVYSKPSPQIMTTPTGSRGNYCDGRIDTFFVNLWDEISTYEWKIPNTCTLIKDLEDSVIMQVPANFKVGWLINRGENVCGVGKIDSISLFGRPLSPSSINGRTYIKPNETNISFSVLDYGYQYLWTVPTGASIVTGQSSAFIIVNWGSISGMVTVEATNICGTSGLKKKMIYAMSNKNSNKEEDTFNKHEYPVIKVYPLPATYAANISYQSKFNTTYTIELFDLIGKKLLTNKIPMKQGMNTFSVNVSMLQKGIYNMVLIDKNNERVACKIVKQ